MIAPVLSPPHTVDFDLYGLVGIRAVSHRSEDCAAVAQALGPIQQRLSRDPDIIVRFVDHIEPAESMCLIGGHDCGFSGDQFFIVRGKNKSTIRVQIPFEDIGGRCEIVCESGLRSIPLLIEIINLTALQQGAIPLHASAFEFNGHGILCAGWAQGGKTETLLGFMANGARYIGDEWVYVQENSMFGIPEPMHIRDWHIDDLPGFRQRLDWRDRLKMCCLRMAAGSVERVGSAKPMNWLVPSRSTQRLASLLNRQRYLEVLPNALFDTPITNPCGQLEHVLFVISHDSPEYRVEPVDVNFVIKSLGAALEQERSHLLEKYRMFQFAFPDRHNLRISAAGQAEADLLRARLSHLPASIVYHPYPMSPVRLFEAIAPLFRARSTISHRIGITIRSENTGLDSMVSGKLLLSAPLAAAKA